MEELSSMLIFGLINGITPGPNNFLLMSSGVSWGFRRSLPLAFGIAMGLPLIMLVTGLGLQKLFQAHVVILTIMKILCGLWMLYLAYGILSSRQPEKKIRKQERPMSFLSALAFQWVNPKVWLIAISAMSLFTPHGGNSTFSIVTIVLVITAAIIPANVIWCLFGIGLAEFLQGEFRLRVFNTVMAILLIYSIFPIFNATW